MQLSASCESDVRTAKRGDVLETLEIFQLEAVLAVSRGLELGVSGGPSQPEFSCDSAVIAGLLGFHSHSSKQEFVENKFAIA